MADKVTFRQSKKDTSLFSAPLRSSNSSQAKPRKIPPPPKTSPDGFALGVDTLGDPFAESPRGQGSINQPSSPKNKKKRAHEAKQAEVRNLSSCVDTIEQLKLKANDLICDFQCTLAPEDEYYDYDYNYEEELEAESPTLNPQKQEQDLGNSYTLSSEDDWQIFSYITPRGWQKI